MITVLFSQFRFKKCWIFGHSDYRLIRSNDSRPAKDVGLGVERIQLSGNRSIFARLQKRYEKAGKPRSMAIMSQRKGKRLVFLDEHNNQHASTSCYAFPGAGRASKVERIIVEKLLPARSIFANDARERVSFQYPRASENQL